MTPAYPCCHNAFVLPQITDRGNLIDLFVRQTSPKRLGVHLRLIDLSQTHNRHYAMYKIVVPHHGRNADLPPVVQALRTLSSSESCQCQVFLLTQGHAPMTRLEVVTLFALNYLDD